MAATIRTFSLMRYLDAALAQAEYTRDEDGVIVAQVPGGSGFFSQGDTFESARANLRAAIEGNVMLALQLGLAIPELPGSDVGEQDA